MNKAILAGGALIATAAAVSAQGTFYASTATGDKPRIMMDGVNVQAADNVWVQILVNRAATIDPFPMRFNGANAGLFSKGIIVVPGVPGGKTVDITVRAWDKDTGYDFANATVKTFATLKDFVLGGVVDANGITGLPTSIVPAFTGLSFATPEPGAYALAALGLGGLLFVRRK